MAERGIGSLPERRPGDRSHLERLIDAWSRDEPDVSEGRLRRLVSISVLAALIDEVAASGGPRAALKGGASFELRFGPGARATADVDATAADVDQFLASISGRLTEGWKGFTGRIDEPVPITRPGLSPPPVRCRVRLSYRGKMFSSMALEVGAQDGDALTDPEIVPSAVDLDRVLLGPAGRVVAINIHHQVAQKIHACTEIPDSGPNHRVHDLYDLMLLDPLVRGRDLAQTRAVCEQTFERRARHRWPPVLPDWPDWPVAWSGLDIPGPGPPTYEEARAAVGRLVDDIRRA